MQAQRAVETAEIMMSVWFECLVEAALFPDRKFATDSGRRSYAERRVLGCAMKPQWSRGGDQWKHKAQRTP